MTKRQTAIITVLSLAAFILAMMTSSRLWLRLDLTKTKAHTISQVSRGLHAELPDPVNITYYISDRLRAIVPAPGEIEDTLREYAVHSRGKIRFSVRDPLKAGVAAIVEELGLQPRQVRSIEQDQASIIAVYSGIVIEYLDRIETLPWVISTETLEYDLTTRIRSMVNNSERTIGVIVGDRYRQWNEDFSLLNLAFANAGIRARLLFPGEEIPDGLPGLFVFGGVEDLDEWALYRIDRYIQLGGKVLFAVKGLYVDTFQTLEARRQYDLGLLDMIASYGVIIRPELALDRNALTIQFQSASPSGGIQYRISRYPPWIGVQGDNGNMEHPVSAGFSGVDLYWASPLELAAPSSVEALALFSSSSEAWVMRETFYTNPEIPYLMEMEAAQTKGEIILGASLSGIFPSFFRGAEKPIREDYWDELPDMPAAARASRVIVIGDADFATDLINATQAAHNLDFLMRAADWILNDDDIISIRNKRQQTGRFDKISIPSRKAAAMRFSQILNVIVIPLLVIAAGLTLASRRRFYARSAGSFAAGAANSVENSAALGELKPEKETDDDL